MIDAMSHDWLPGLARATLFTVLAALLAALLLKLLRVRSPRIDRLAWLLVVAQGWLLFVGTWNIEVVREQLPPPAPIPDAVAPAAGVVAYGEPYAAPETEPRVISWTLATWFIAGWACGAAVLVALNLRSYARVVRRLPLGEAPERDDWREEWRRSVAASAAGKSVRFRITERLGPLLCYLPFAYYLLAPRGLWSNLAPAEREAILRHELAHLARGDLWKSLVIRLLALPQWFNPAVWWAVRRFDEAGEWAADDLASGASGQHETSYARALLRVAECTRSHAAQTGALAARGGVISRRIKRLISPRFKEEPVMKKLVIPTLLLAVALGQVVRIRAVAEDAPENGYAQKSLPVVPDVPPADIADAKLPEYRVASPDVLLVRATSDKPRENARLRPGDRLAVTIQEEEAGKQFDIVSQTGTKTEWHFKVTQVQVVVMIDDDGRFNAVATQVNSGAGGGLFVPERVCDSFAAAGLTLLECAEKITGSLDKSYQLASPRVSVKLASERVFDQKTLVWPDGKVRLGDYGDVHLAGMSLDEARRTLDEHLSQHIDNVQVSVDVFSNNHWVYYVITQGGDQEETVSRFPVTGNETVLDALANLVLPNPVELSAAKMWIARPGPDKKGGNQILPVDLRAITQAGNTATNFRLMPGDRLFIECGEAIKVGEAKTRPLSPPPIPPTPHTRPQHDTAHDAAVVEGQQFAEEILVHYKIIEDTTGALADNALFRDGMNIVDATEVDALIESLRDSNKIKVLSAPKILTVFDRPAKLRVGQEKPVDSDIKPDGMQLDAIATKKRLSGSASDSAPETVIDLHASVTKQGRTVEFESGFVHYPGKANLLRLSPSPGEERGDGVGAVHAVIAPEIITGGPLQPVEPSQAVQLPKPTERR